MFARPHLTPCTVEIEHTHDHFHAHVSLDGDPDINPGDRVRVHGDPISCAFGHAVTVRRMASVHRAGLLERIWTRLTSRLELYELYEVSFTPRRSL